MPLTSHHFTHPVATQPLPAARMGLALWVMGMPGAVALAHTAPPAWLVTLADGASAGMLAWIAVMGFGIMLALAGSLPISPYVTSISFFIFVVCRVIRAVRQRHSASGRAQTKEIQHAPAA